MTRPLLTAAGLTVSYPSGAAVTDVDFTVTPGQCLAIVGRSGAGKSSIAKALLGLSGRNTAVSATTLDFDGTDLLEVDERQWNKIRGSRIGLVLQDALVSLDPLRTIGAELSESLAVHGTVPRSGRRAEALALLDAVHAGHLGDRLDDYPHQLSGGERQRVLIASALAARPSLLVVDEPVTALDPVARAGIARLLAGLRDSGLAILLISHDLDFVAGLADDVVVLDRGRVVEAGPLPEVFDDPGTDTTASLLAAAPSRRPLAAPHVPGRPVLRLDGVTKVYPDGGRGVHSVDVTVGFGEAVGLVGASGSGKSTIAALALAFVEPTSGTVEVYGRPWSGRPERERRGDRRRIQLVDQDTLSTFDPRHRVRTILAEPLRARGIGDRKARAAKIDELLATVELDPNLAHSRPGELSGGQRQRLAIARALATEPDVLVCDEPVSALDQVTQAAILDLLGALRRRGLALLLISHDLAVVRSLCSRIVVLRDGRIVEDAPAERICNDPGDPYTRSLIDHNVGVRRDKATSLT